MATLNTTNIKHASSSSNNIVLASNGSVTIPTLTATSLTTNTNFGKILQVVSATKTDTASNSTASSSWWSYTDSSLKATITPISASSKILITGVISIGVDSQQYMMVRLEKNGSRLNAANGDQDGNKSRIFSGVWYSPESTPNTPYPNFIVQYLDTAGDTNSRYYNFGIAHTSGLSRTIYLNRGVSATNAFATMTCASTITAMEVAA